MGCFRCEPAKQKRMHLGGANWGEHELKSTIDSEIVKCILSELFHFTSPVGAELSQRENFVQSQVGGSALLFSNEIARVGRSLCSMLLNPFCTDTASWFALTHSWCQTDLSGLSVSISATLFDIKTYAQLGPLNMGQFLNKVASCDGHGLVAIRWIQSFLTHHIVEHLWNMRQIASILQPPQMFNRFYWKPLKWISKIHAISPPCHLLWPTQPYILTK